MGLTPTLKLSGRVACSTGPTAILRLADAGEERCDPVTASWLEDNGEEVADNRSRVKLECRTDWETVPPVNNTVLVGTEFAYLQPGDIVRIDRDRRWLNVLYRRQSRFNSILVTERCNSYCLMCSQPPKPGDDGFLLDEYLQAIPLMDHATQEIGITGGEPTLLHDRLILLLQALRDTLPLTAVHMLTNGRLLAYLQYAEKISALRHPDLMLAIPLYSDVPWEHDFVVQAQSAFDQTIRGILNLGRLGQRVEIRIVIHQQTYKRLPHLARFVARNLPFVSHVALMGLEPMGHVKMNWSALWVDALDYQDQLACCVNTLHHARIPVSIYNHQLCTLSESLRPFAVKAISDWKQTYLPECQGCSQQTHCGGFFSWALENHSRGIRPLISS